jgi:membrane protein implicated in regulation of membrane protease activity
MIVTLLLVLLRETINLPIWLGVVLFFLVVFKDLAIFPAMSQAFRPSGAGWPRLIGARGRTIEPLGPTGYIQVKGELWRAEARDTAKRILAGSEVVVVDERGLTLLVEEDRRSPITEPGSLVRAEPGSRRGLREPEPPPTPQTAFAWALLLPASRGLTRPLFRRLADACHRAWSLMPAVLQATMETKCPTRLRIFCTSAGVPRSDHVRGGSFETARKGGHRSRTDREKFSLGMCAYAC